MWPLCLITLPFRLWLNSDLDGLFGATLCNVSSQGPRQCIARGCVACTPVRTEGWLSGSVSSGTAGTVFVVVAGWLIPSHSPGAKIHNMEIQRKKNHQKPKTTHYIGNYVVKIQPPGKRFILGHSLSPLNSCWRFKKTLKEPSTHSSPWLMPVNLHPELLQVVCHTVKMPPWHGQCSSPTLQQNSRPHQGALFWARSLTGRNTPALRRWGKRPPRRPQAESEECRILYPRRQDMYVCMYI